MKVLLVTSDYSNSWPFLPELQAALFKNSVTVNILDVGSLKLIDERGNILHEDKIGGSLNLIRGGHRFIRFTARRFIRTRLSSYDAINIHNLSYIYKHLLPDFRKLSNNISITIWGSDFYRVSDQKLASYKYIFDETDYFTFGSKYPIIDFDKRVPGYSEKLKITSFGIGKFYILRNLFKDRLNVKKELEIPTDKISVVCGYNASSAQQHKLLINQIKTLPLELKEKIFVVVPLTYSGTEEYKNEVELCIYESGLSYKLFRDFATEEEIAKIRVIGDIVLNAQISDGFSSSLQEHVLCNAVLIAGDWLPYKIMTDLGLKFYPVQLHEFGEKLADVISNFEAYYKEVQFNHEKLFKEGIWDNRIKGWIDLYKLKQ